MAEPARVAAWMSTPLEHVARTASLAAVADRLLALDVSALGVQGAEGGLVGLVSRSDLVRLGRIHPVEHVTHVLRIPEGRAERVMRTALVTVAPDDPLPRAAALMVRHRIHRVVVTEPGGRPLGILTTRDLARAAAALPRELSLSRHQTSPVLTIDVSAPAITAVDLLVDAQVGGLVVLEEGWPVGLFSQREALASRDEPGDRPVGELLSEALVCLPPHTPLADAARHLAHAGGRRVLSVEGRRLVGILTGLDVAAALAA